MSQIGARRHRARQAARIFEARYAGKCCLCDGRFEVGEDITWVDDLLAHAGCPGPGGAV